MKKCLFILIYCLFLIFFTNTTINAEEGTCIIQQLSNTYEVETPFYWYEVTKNNEVNSMMQQTVTYNHKKNYIDTSTKCNKINKSTPQYVSDSNNFLNSTITTFYFSKKSITDSKTIYDGATSLFKHSPSTTDLTIKSYFLSLDELPPILTTEDLNPTIITSLDEVISIIYLQTKITAYDEVDGPVSVKIHEDNYTSNSKNIGEYTVTFSASDNSSNTSYLTITIQVKDTTKPTIKGSSNITSSMSNPLNVNQIKSSLTVTDNYYNIANSSINIVKDNFTGNEQKEGSFTILFNVIDPSNNISDNFVVTIKNLDDIPPIINGESSYEISNKTLLNLDEILNKLTASDNIDNNPTIELLNDTYTDSYFKIGLYQISFIAKDKNNNISLPYIININVKDFTKPTIYISKKFIGIDGNANINIQDIIEIIETTNNINPNNLLSFEIVKDEYTPNRNTPGEYFVELSYEYENGDYINIETCIVVDSYNQTTKEEIKSTPKKTFWSAIKEIFLKIWNYIKYFFSFNWLKI